VGEFDSVQITIGDKHINMEQNYDGSIHLRAHKGKLAAVSGAGVNVLDIYNIGDRIGA
jgi:hypothetical protein